MRLRISSRQEGQGLVEYALILVLIAVAVLLTVTLLGQRINMVFAQILLQMEYPGNYSGPITNPSNPSIGVDKLTLIDPPQVMASIDNIDLGLDVAPGTTYCVSFSHSGGGSDLACGSPPETYFDPDPNGGSVTGCLVAIEGHSIGGGPYCGTGSYE